MRSPWGSWGHVQAQWNKCEYIYVEMFPRVHDQARGNIYIYRIVVFVAVGVLLTTEFVVVFVAVGVLLTTEFVVVSVAVGVLLNMYVCIYK